MASGSFLDPNDTRYNMTQQTQRAANTPKDSESLNTQTPESSNTAKTSESLSTTQPPPAKKNKKRKRVITPEFVNNSLSEHVKMCASTHPDQSPAAALHSFKALCENDWKIEHVIQTLNC